MRIAFLLPCPLEPPRGNVTTARRLARELGRRGFACSLHPAGELPDQAGAVVALHAAHRGPAAAAWAQEQRAKCVILFTGTDLNGRPRAATGAAVAAADALVCLSQAAARRARTLFHPPPEKLHVILQGADPLPAGRGAWPAQAPALEPGAELVLCPAGIRAVKAPRRALHELGPLAAERSALRLWFAGPSLEARETAALEEELRPCPWAAWLGPVPRERLLPLYQRAAVILSTSRSEGGPPNALLEAALARRPILASSIPAHREFLPVECLFRDARELRHKLRAVLDDPGPALLRAARLAEEIRDRYAPLREATEWAALLKNLGGAGGSAQGGENS